MRRIGLAFILLALCIHSPAAADQNWGYLWDLRTMRLHPLAGTSVTIGRLAQSDIVLSEEKVSRRHAEIRRNGDGIVLLDRKSTNGTRLNGSPVHPGEASPIAPGDLLQFAFEKMIYHESQAELWEDVLRFTYLSSIVRLRVPVLQDRKVKSLGRERIVAAVSHASVDLETEKVEMTYPDERVRDQPAFQPEAAAFICNLSLSEGELRMSLWGLGRSKLVSRRGSLANLTHGELTVGVLSESAPEARKRFEEKWSSDGARFLFQLLGPVMERVPEGESSKVLQQLARALIEREELTAPRDAADMLGLLHRLDPTNKEVVVLAAGAEAAWVQRRAEKSRVGVSDEERSELLTALAASREWLQKAVELGSREKDIKKVEAEISEAVELLERVP